MTFYKYVLNYNYFKIDGSDPELDFLVMEKLFNTSTTYLLINPNQTGPNDILSTPIKNAMKATSSSDFRAIAPTYLDSSWISNSWDTSSSFYSQLNTWLINNITDSYLSPFITCDVVIMQGYIVGNNYTIVFCYPGNFGEAIL